MVRYGESTVLISVKNLGICTDVLIFLKLHVLYCSLLLNGRQEDVTYSIAYCIVYTLYSIVYSLYCIVYTL